MIKNILAIFTMLFVLSSAQAQSSCDIKVVQGKYDTMCQAVCFAESLTECGDSQVTATSTPYVSDENYMCSCGGEENQEFNVTLAN